MINIPIVYTLVWWPIAANQKNKNRKNKIKNENKLKK